MKLAAKLLIIAWTLMKKKEPFNPDYLSGWNDRILHSTREPEQQRRGREDLGGDNPGPLT